MSVATPIPARPSVPVPLVGAGIATDSVASVRAAPVHPSVTVPVRVMESPADLRGRLLRAAVRLNLMLAAGGHTPTRWTLRLERRGGATAMPLPPPR